VHTARGACGEEDEDDEESKDASGEYGSQIHRAVAKAAQEVR
jgi:hypothetical protein